ncbi:MAG: hypothetical protein ACKO6B_17060 [Planctomycetia bacterium]
MLVIPPALLAGMDQAIHPGLYVVLLMVAVGLGLPAGWLVVAGGFLYGAAIGIPAVLLGQAAGLTLNMKPQAVSNQLQRLCSLGIIRSRRAGVNVHYRVVDLCVRSLLDQGLCLTEEATKRNLGE